MEFLKQNVNLKPYKGFRKLNKGYHEVELFKIVDNMRFKDDDEKSGPKKCLIAELSDQILYLPEYFAREFMDHPERLRELNNEKEKTFLYFAGKRKSG